MAGNPDTIYIYVYGVDSSVTPTITPTPNYFSNFSYVTDHWIASINYTYTFPMTISAEGYGSKTVNNYSVSSMMYVEVTLSPSHLYAWTYSTQNATFWTDTETPTTSSIIYDENGNNVTSTYVQGECYISSVSGNTITYSMASKGEWLLPATDIYFDSPRGTAVYNRENSRDLVWNSSSNSYISPKPENLYAWTDSSITEEPLYAWTTSSTSIANNNNVPTTFYTTTATPSTSSKIYDENGNDITSLFNDGYKYFTSSSSSVMTWFYASGGGGVII